jgi:hypothetical protein
MTECVQLILFGLLFAMVLGWLALSAMLYQSLRDRHPGAYEKLWNGGLINNKHSMRNAFRSLRFLVDGEFESLKDPPLSKLCRCMRVYFWCYMILFLFLVGFSLMTIPNPSVRGR